MNAAEAGEPKPADDYGLLVVELPIGTRFYSGIQKKIDPSREFWAFINVPFFVYSSTVEAAREWLDAHNHTDVSPEDIYKFVPEWSYARSFEAWRPCSLVVSDHDVMRPEQVQERYGPGATFKSTKWFDWDDARRKEAWDEAELNENGGNGGHYSKKATSIQTDGFTQCDSGLDVAIFTLQSIKPGETESCFRQVGEDRLLTEKEMQSTDWQNSMEGPCYRYFSGR